MKVINFGSINIDHVYEVPRFVRAGETLASTNYHTFAGGKGLNQSVALAKAGAPVMHAGKIGQDGRWLLSELTRAGVEISSVIEGDVPTGHAIIQVSSSGENSILLFGGANQTVQAQDVDKTLGHADRGDFILLQNEINGVGDIIRNSKNKGLQIVLNPAPFDSSIKKLPLNLVNYLILNETEGAGLTGKTAPKEIIEAITTDYPDCAVVLTLGADGVLYQDNKESIFLRAEKVIAVDTTAAGDTFIGYFLSGLAKGLLVKEALATANKAAGICVTRKGAAVSIPAIEEVARAT
jgi:ribokinase